MPVFKMVVLLCSLSAIPYDKCDETNAIAINRMSRIAPYAARCEHDSQHEQMQMLYRDKLVVDQAFADHKGPAYDPADRKIKVLCIKVETSP